jgi:hypothetical protein
LRKRKIINDPLYGFIRISEEIIFDLIEHPYFQRLRRIKQLGLTHLIYPGALHTRFHHALGAMHLMQKALTNLRSKGVEISDEEYTGALIAILLHDIGHGPFSHSLEHAIVEGVNHEMISVALMEDLNRQFNGQLETGISIFNGSYPKKFLHDLVSSQLDVDRLDYLRRDSFYTGVSEGIVGLDRIIEMMAVDQNELVIERKGIYSVEKFIIARRMMYWQVYLHKTSVAVDQLIVAILKRAKWLTQNGDKLFASSSLQYFLNHTGAVDLGSPEVIDRFTAMDDTDLECAMKEWIYSSDKVLSELCRRLVQRDLPKIHMQSEEITQADYEQAIGRLRQVYPDWNQEELDCLIYRGMVKNDAYKAEQNSIKVLDKHGLRTELSLASDNYNLHALEETVTKYFICYPK